MMLFVCSPDLPDCPENFTGRILWSMYSSHTLLKIEKRSDPSLAIGRNMAGRSGGTGK